MATIPQIRGMLLEEAVLHLLRSSGYVPVLNAGTDPTLHDGKAGLEVHGRGGLHQIDAIADPLFSPAFSNSHRLLLEAKCYANKSVGIDKIRNAIGVLKDVSEYWVPPQGPTGLISTSRYHYQYAMFSASGFSPEAEKYAFAHDVFLIQYQRSKYMSSVIRSIQAFEASDFYADNEYSVNVDMTQLRSAIRRGIREGQFAYYTLDMPSAEENINIFIRSVTDIDGTLLALAAGRFPIHLVPAPDIQLSGLSSYNTVRIRWDSESWYLEDTHNNRLFSFDLPLELFDLYADHGMLSEHKALDLKERYFDTLQAIYTTNTSIRLITFQLDVDWIQSIRMRANTLRGWIY